MVEEEVTGFSGVPSTYAHLLRKSLLAGYRDQLGSLRYCSQAGGHMARTTKEALLKILPEHTQLFVMYGATEASARLSYVEPDRLVEKIESIGRPIPEVTMSVLGEDDVELPSDQIGEIVASGANITSSYWCDSDATQGLNVELIDTDKKAKLL
jgi:long-chain acyl-CoA synthetase